MRFRVAREPELSQLWEGFVGVLVLGDRRRTSKEPAGRWRQERQSYLVRSRDGSMVSDGMLEF